MKQLIIACVVAIPATASAGNVKAQALCGVVTSGKVEVVVPTPDKRKLDKPISCAVHLDAAPDGAALSASVGVTTDGVDGTGHGDAITKTKDFEVQLSPGTDYTTCKTFSIVAKVTDDNHDNKVLWQTAIVVEQACVAAKAGPPPPPPGDADTAFATQGSDPLPESARGTVTTWVSTYVLLDGTFFDAFPAKGVKIGKKLVTRAAVKKLADAAGGLYKLTKIMPMFECKDSVRDFEKHPENCNWAKWHVHAASKSELWIYNSDDSYYGPYTSAVFKKQGKAWVWTDVKSLDLGEP